MEADQLGYFERHDAIRCWRATKSTDFATRALAIQDLNQYISAELFLEGFLAFSLELRNRLDVAWFCQNTTVN
jgi:hypothetical protein